MMTGLDIVSFASDSRGSRARCGCHMALDCFLPHVVSVIGEYEGGRKRNRL